MGVGDDSKINFGVNINVSDIFQQTQAIRQAIELSAKQAFTSSPTFSEQFSNVGSQLQPVQYAQPSFVRVTDPYAQQREGIIQRTFNSLPAQIYTPADVDANMYQYQSRQDFDNRIMAPTAAAGIAGVGTLGIYGGMQWALNRSIPAMVEPRPLFAGLRTAMGMKLPTEAVPAASRYFGNMGLAGIRTGWLSTAERFGLAGRVGAAVGLGALTMAPFMVAQQALNYTVDEFVNEVQTRSTVRDIGLEVMDPMNSTAPGGRGFTRAQTEDLSRWTRGLVKDTGIKTPQMLGIMEFAATTGQYSGSQDVQQIKEKTKAILKSLNDIAKESRASLEEVMGYARDMTNMGFTPGTSSFKGFAQQVTSAARWTGMQGREVMGMATMGAEMFRGTGINMTYGANAMVQALPTVAQMKSAGIISSELMAQLGGTPEAVARQSVMNQQSFIMSQKGTVMLAGLAGSGGVGSFLSGQTSLGGVVNAAGGIGSNMQSIAKFMMNQGKMWGSMDPMDVRQVQGKMVDQMLGMSGLEKSPEMFAYAAMNIFPGQFRSPMEAELFAKQYKYDYLFKAQRTSSDAVTAVESDVARSRTLFAKGGAWLSSLADPTKASSWSPIPGLAVGAGAIAGGIKIAGAAFSGLGTSLHQGLITAPSDFWHSAVLGETATPATTHSEREAMISSYKETHNITEEKSTYRRYGEVGAGLKPNTALAQKLLDNPVAEWQVRNAERTGGFHAVNRVVRGLLGDKTVSERQVNEVTVGAFKNLRMDLPKVEVDRKNLAKEYGDIQARVTKAETKAALTGFNSVSRNSGQDKTFGDNKFWGKVNEIAGYASELRSAKTSEEKQKINIKMQKTAADLANHYSEDFKKISNEQGQIEFDMGRVGASEASQKEFIEAAAHDKAQTPGLVFDYLESSGQISPEGHSIISKALKNDTISKQDWDKLPQQFRSLGNYDPKRSVEDFRKMGVGAVKDTIDKQVKKDKEKEIASTGGTDTEAITKGFRSALESTVVQIKDVGKEEKSTSPLLSYVDTKPPEKK